MPLLRIDVCDERVWLHDRQRWLPQCIVCQAFLYQMCLVNDLVLVIDKDRQRHELQEAVCGGLNPRRVPFERSLIVRVDSGVFVWRISRLRKGVMNSESSCDLSVL